MDRLFELRLNLFFRYFILFFPFFCIILECHKFAIYYLDSMSLGSAFIKTFYDPYHPVQYGATSGMSYSIPTDIMFGIIATTSFSLLVSALGRRCVNSYVVFFTGWLSLSMAEIYNVIVTNLIISHEPKINFGIKDIVFDVASASMLTLFFYFIRYSIIYLNRERTGILKLKAQYYVSYALAPILIVVAFTFLFAYPVPNSLLLVSKGMEKVSLFDIKPYDPQSHADLIKQSHRNPDELSINSFDDNNIRNRISLKTAGGTIGVFPADKHLMMQHINLSSPRLPQDKADENQESIHAEFSVFTNTDWLREWNEKAKKGNFANLSEGPIVKLHELNTIYSLFVLNEVSEVLIPSMREANSDLYINAVSPKSENIQELRFERNACGSNCNEMEFFGDDSNLYSVGKTRIVMQFRGNYEEIRNLALKDNEIVDHIDNIVAETPQAAKAPLYDIYSKTVVFVDISKFKGQPLPLIADINASNQILKFPIRKVQCVNCSLNELEMDAQTVQVQVTSGQFRLGRNAEAALMSGDSLTIQGASQVKNHDDKPSVVKADKAWIYLNDTILNETLIDTISTERKIYIALIAIFLLFGREFARWFKREPRPVKPGKITIVKE